MVLQLSGWTVVVSWYTQTSCTLIFFVGERFLNTMLLHQQHKHATFLSIVCVLVKVKVVAWCAGAAGAALTVW